MALGEPLQTTTLVRLDEPRLSLAAMGIVKAVAHFLESPRYWILGRVLEYFRRWSIRLEEIGFCKPRRRLCLIREVCTHTMPIIIGLQWVVGNPTTHQRRI